MSLLLLMLREGGGQLSLGFIYWFLLLVWIVFGGWSGYSLAGPERTRYWGGNLLHFILLFIIGLALFGFPIGG